MKAIFIILTSMKCLEVLNPLHTVVKLDEGSEAMPLMKESASNYGWQESFQNVNQDEVDKVFILPSFRIMLCMQEDDG